MPDAPAPPSIAQWMARATTTAAATVEIDPVRDSFLEARLEHALIAAWAANGGAASRARRARGDPTSARRVVCVVVSAAG